MITGRSRFSVQIAAVLAAVAMICATFVGLTPTTREGVFCPTAPIQTVQLVKRDCCDRLIGAVKRAPRPGERGFIQCRCAEKKSAHEAILVASKIGLFFQDGPPPVAASSPLRGPFVAFRSSDDVRAVPFVPDVPPPPA